VAVLVAGLMLMAQVGTPFDEEVAAVASEAGVAQMDLAGAVASTGLSPRQYMWMTGELEPPPAPTVRVQPDNRAGASGWTVWDRLAECEASGIWSNASNPRYKGGLQMDATFWARYGGLAYAAAPHHATREQQIAVAIRGQAVQGWGAWPACSRRLGLR
jgi:hypothetical protein